MTDIHTLAGHEGAVEDCPLLVCQFRPNNTGAETMTDKQVYQDQYEQGDL